MLETTGFRRYVIRPTLGPISIWSVAIENLLIGTGLAESYMSALRQYGGGSAIGLFQMESTTYDSLWHDYLDYRPNLRARVLRFAAGPIIPPEADQMAWNLALATVMARIKYMTIPEPLPDANDIEELASYWKRHYNTAGGKGKPEEFVNRYQLFGGHK